MNPDPRPLFEQFGCVIESAGQALSDLPAAEVRASLRRHGAVLFRGFQSDSESFEAFSRTFCDRFYFHPHPKRVPVGRDGFSDLAPPGLHEIKLHTERAYEPAFARPHLLWFHCIRPATAAGETVMCDGAQLWQRLPARLRDAFTRNRLLYVLPYPSRLLQGDWLRHFISSVQPEPTRAYAEAVMRDDPDVEYSILHGGKLLVLKHLVSAVTPGRFGDRMAFANNLLNRRFASFVQFEDFSTVKEEMLCEIDEIAAPITFGVSWHRGDILLIDNERVLHGRRAHQDASRELHVRFGRDRFLGLP